MRIMQLCHTACVVLELVTFRLERLQGNIYYTFLFFAVISCHSYVTNGDGKFICRWWIKIRGHLIEHLLISPRLF